MNEAVEVLGSGLQQLIEAVKSASPAMWEAAQQSVKANIAVAQFWESIGLGILAIGCVGIVLGIILSVTVDNFDFLGLSLFSVLPALGGLIMWGACHAEIIRLETAPNWYAIEALRRLV